MFCPYEDIGRWLPWMLLKNIQSDAIGIIRIWYQIATLSSICVVAPVAACITQQQRPAGLLIAGSDNKKSKTIK